MDSADQQPVDASSNPTRSPESLLAESRATFERNTESAGETDVASRSEYRTAVPSDPSPETFTSHVHNYVSDYIRFADQKAAFIFTISAGLLCYLFKNNIHKMWLKDPGLWVALDILCFVAMCCLTFALAFSCWVIAPILRKTHRGFVFFRSISEFESSTSFACEVLSTPAPKLTHALLQNTYDLSRICCTKYWKLAVAVWLGAIGVLSSVVVLLLRP